VDKFEQRYHRNSDFIVARFECNGLKQFSCVLALALGGDGRRRVQN
jgi:hypothetical protein